MKRLALLALFVTACQVNTGQQPPAQQAQGWPQPQPQPQPFPQPQPQPQPQPVVQRPLLAPLVGVPAMQNEVRSVLTELIRNLPVQYSKKISGIPLVFDATAEVNAYAGCDDNGTAFMAGTSGLIDAVDGMSQTVATDELFGTKTYDAFVTARDAEAPREGTRSARRCRSGSSPSNISPTPAGSRASTRSSTT